MGLLLTSFLLCLFEYLQANMKAFLVLAAVVGVAYAGVGTLSPQEEAQALQLFQQICASGGEGSSLGDTLVYCKRGRGGQSENLNHNVNIGAGQGPQNQVVFVQPPPVRYVHRVAISGGGAAGQQAKIYVLPQKASHELSAQYQGGSQQAVKPVVYFLSGGAGGNGGGGNGGGNGGNGGGNGGNGGGNGGGGYNQGGSGGGNVYQQGGGYNAPVRNTGGYN